MSQRIKKRASSPELDSEEDSVHIDDFIEIEQKQSLDDEELNGSGKKSLSGIVTSTPGPVTQHRNKLLSKVKEKIKKNLSIDIGQSIFDLKTKLALIEAVKEANKRRTVSSKLAVKTLDWSLVDIDGLTTEDAKECLKQILAPVNALRTLDEMLNDYLAHYQKYELKNSPNAPKLPQNPVMRYVTEHRAEFEAKLKKKNPGKPIKLGEVSKFGAKRFHKLPEEEKARYKEQYKKQLEEYHNSRNELIRLNPELKKPRKKYPASTTKKPADSTSKSKSGDKEDTTITPFKFFLQEMREKNSETRYQEAQTQYKNLGDHEKLSYINKVLHLDTTLDKIFTADEKKIMKHSSGLPVRPLSAYNAFVQGTIKNGSIGKGKNSMNVISELWKNLTEEEKGKWHQKHLADLEQWKAEMMRWISALPIDQQAEQIAKYKLFKKATKRKREESQSEPDDVEIKIEPTTTKNIIEIARVEETRPKSPKKKQRDTSGSEDMTIASPPKASSKQSNEMDWDNVFSSSPKKDNIEKHLAALGPYPSQTTAHFFMTHKCEGKSVKKIAKAYKELSRAEKKKLFQEMNEKKKEYFDKLKAFAKKLDPKHNNKVIEFHKSNKEEQDKNTNWHVPSRTDNDDSSSSSSSDSDDS